MKKHWPGKTFGVRARADERRPGVGRAEVIAAARRAIIDKMFRLVIAAGSMKKPIGIGLANDVRHRKEALCLTLLPARKA